MGFRNILLEIGYFCLFLAFLLATFVVYELWITNYQTQGYQNTLKSILSHSVPAPNNNLINQSGRTNNEFQLIKLPLKANPSADNITEGAPLAYIIIPKINLDMVVVQGTSETDLRLGPGHYLGTSYPGYAGNVAIAGHRTTYLHPFYNLDKLSAGDLIMLQTINGLIVYSVTNIDVRSPGALGVLSQTGDDRITLTTCNPKYSAATRLVVVGHYIGIEVYKNSNLKLTNNHTVIPNLGIPARMKNLTSAPNESIFLWAMFIAITYILFRVFTKGLWHRSRWIGSILMGLVILAFLYSLWHLLYFMSIVLPSSL
jgi:LPXTG-site transpeptidase (sortase) family protein